ncbi:MAG: hypothetical protein MI919_14985 [Holophagales bacterium]|nr:hypothetical protein [Holophagales bacterium]
MIAFPSLRFPLLPRSPARHRSPARSWRSPLLARLAIFGLAALGLAGSASAQATVSGTVYDPGGVPVGAGYRVELITGAVSEADSTETSAIGEFELQATQEGNYDVLVRPPAGSPFINQFYPDVVCPVVPTDCVIYSRGNLFVPSAGSVTGIDLFLTEGGAIEGVVTDATTGLPVGGVEVGAFVYEPFAPGFERPQAVKRTTTSIDGSYRIQALPTPGNGGFYVFTKLPYGSVYSNTAYPGTACTGLACDGTEGLQVPTRLGETTTGIDLPLYPQGSCGTGPSLCLGQGGRFRVDVDWQSSDDADVGKPHGLTRDTGHFWFFESDNVEVVLKVLDGCEINGHYWIYASGLTDVAVSLTVTDTETSEVWARQTALDTAFPPMSDIQAFACDPGGS